MHQKYRNFRALVRRGVEFVSRSFEGKRPTEYVPDAIIERRKRWSRNLFSFVSAGCAAFLLILPNPTEKPIPNLRTGDIANENITSPLTIEIEPNSRSKFRREELAKRVAPVFDYDDTILDVWRGNWEQTFKVIRNDYYKDPEQGFTGSLEALEQRIQELTGQTLRAQDLLYLHQNKFSYTHEKDFVKIASGLKGRLIAPSDLFPSYYSTGIVVREVNRSLQETLINDVSRIWGLDHAKEALSHIPNLAKDEDRERMRRIVQIVNSVIVSNLKFNANLTQARIAAALGNIQPNSVRLSRGEVVIQKGERINEDKAEIVTKLRSLTTISARVKRFGLQLLILFLFFSVVLRLAVSRRGLWHLTFKDAVFFALISLASLALVKFPLPFIKLFFEPFNLKHGVEYLLPIATGGIIIHLMMGKEAALAFAIINSTLIGALLDTSYFFAVWAFTVTISAVRSIRSCKQRTDLYRCGVWSGFVGAVIVSAHLLMQSLGLQTISVVDLGISVSLAFLSGLLASILTSSLIPILEAVFGYTTSLKLLELSNFNHPLLHQLMMKAPGTYHHSVIVGSLAEIAADNIRANGLLARVSAYYHDIGKMNKPLYFIENQSPNNNPHDHLSPTMSAKILFSHVKNGAKLAREHNLGEAITNIIEQHHGTTLIAYFFNKAKKSEDPEHDHVSESDFRYPGPRPQSREAAIVMLADACEAATRSINEPTPSKIETMVHSIINRRFLEEQFNECDLTLSDLRVIEACFVRTLVSLYHHRVQYPGQKTDTVPNPPSSPPLSNIRKIQGN